MKVDASLPKEPSDSLEVLAVPSFDSEANNELQFSCPD